MKKNYENLFIEIREFSNVTVLNMSGGEGADFDAGELWTSGSNGGIQL